VHIDNFVDLEKLGGRYNVLVPGFVLCCFVGFTLECNEPCKMASSHRGLGLHLAPSYSKGKMD